MRIAVTGPPGESILVSTASRAEAAPAHATLGADGQGRGGDRDATGVVARGGNPRVDSIAPDRPHRRTARRLARPAGRSVDRDRGPEGGRRSRRSSRDRPHDRIEIPARRRDGFGRRRGRRSAPVRRRSVPRPQLVAAPPRNSALAPRQQLRGAARRLAVVRIPARTRGPSDPADARSGHEPGRRLPERRSRSGRIRGAGRRRVRPGVRRRVLPALGNARRRRPRAPRVRDAGSREELARAGHRRRREGRRIGAGRDAANQVGAAPPAARIRDQGELVGHRSARAARHPGAPGLRRGVAAAGRGCESTQARRRVERNGRDPHLAFSPRDRGLARGVRIDRRHDGRSIGWPAPPARRGAAVRRNRDSRLRGDELEAVRRDARGSRCAARTEDARWLLGDARRPDGVRNHAARAPCAVGHVRSRSGSLRLRRGARHSRRVPADRAPRARRVSGKSGGRVGARGLPERLRVPDRGAARASSRAALRDRRRSSRARPRQRRHEDRGRARRPAEPRDAPGRARAGWPRALPRGRPRRRSARRKPPYRDGGNRRRDLGARQRGLARRVRARSGAAARNSEGRAGTTGSKARGDLRARGAPEDHRRRGGVFRSEQPVGTRGDRTAAPSRIARRRRGRDRDRVRRPRARRRTPHLRAFRQGDACVRHHSSRAQAVLSGRRAGARVVGDRDPFR